MKMAKGARASVIVVAAIAGILAAGAVLAATLPLSAGQLGTTVATADCQSASLSPSWAYEYDADLPGYRINAVILDGLQVGCLDKSVQVVLADSSGTAQAYGAGTTPSSGIPACRSRMRPTSASAPMSKGTKNFRGVPNGRTTWPSRA